MTVVLAASALAVPLVVVAAPEARADVIESFALTTDFELLISPPEPNVMTIDGSLTIDTTIGTIVGASGNSLFAPECPMCGPLPTTQGFNASDNGYTWNLTGQYYGLQLVFLVPSLIGYTGGDLASISNPTSSGAYTTFGEELSPGYALTSGSVGTVPEPSAVAIFGSALAGLALILLQAPIRRSAKARRIQHSW